MLRYIYSAATLMTVLAAPALAQHLPVRQAQLIRLGSGATSSSEVPASDAPQEIASAEPALSQAMLNAFRVHDLSRQYVEFQMAQGFNGASAEPSPLNAEPGRVAPVSSIAVPTWMRIGAYYPAIRYTPGCTPIPYAPSGLLGYAAEARRASYYAMMSSVACEHGIPVGLFDAVIMRESRYNAQALSSAKAFGLTQLMPGTAYGLGVNRYDVVQNLRGGARYLRQQLDRYGQVHLALAAYNAGPGRVKTAVPRIAETQAYVSSILTNWSRLSDRRPAPMQRANSAIYARARGATVLSF